MSTYNINHLSRLPVKLGYYLFTFFVFTLLAIAFFKLHELGTFNVYNSPMPHILIATALILVLINNNLFTTRPISTDRNDTPVLVFFAIVCLNVFYSEMRGLSWQVAAYLFDAVCLYYIARIFLYHHLKLFFIVATAFFCWAYVSPYSFSDLTSPFRPYGSAKAFMGLFFFYSVLACVFILWRRITAVHVFLFVLTFLLVFCFALYRIFSPLFAYFFETESYSIVHQYLQTLETSFSIFSTYPLFGSGIGSYPFAYEAFRTGPPLSISTVQSSFFISISELGTIGILAFLWMPLTLLKNTFSVLRCIRHSGMRIWLCVFAFAEVIWLCCFIFSSQTLHVISWNVLFVFHGILVSLVSSKEYKRRTLNSSIESTQLASNYYMSFTSSVKLGLVISLILVGTVLSCAPTVTYSAIDRLASQKPTINTVNNLARINARFPFCAEAWDLYAKQLDALQKYKLTDTKEALLQIQECLTLAKELSPYTPAFYTRLAQAYNFDHKKSQVLEVLSQGVANNPNDATLRLLFARELALNNNNPGAVTAAKAALFGFYRGKADLYMVVAEYMLRNSVPPSAARYLQYAVQYTPDPNISKDKIYNLGNQIGMPTIVFQHCL